MKTVHGNAKLAKSIVNASFQSGTFSERLWRNQVTLRTELESLLVSGLVQGKNPRALAPQLEKIFDVSKNAAERLMRTELARVQTDAQMESYKQAGYTQYMFITVGAAACQVCSKLNGEVFNVADMSPGTNAPPMHPNCRCSTAAYMNRDALFKAVDIYNEAKEQEPEVTALLKGIEEKTGAKLRGLENNLKSTERIYQKLVAESDKKVRDALRYTFELDETKYVSEYKRIVALLGQEGYTLSAVKNYWKDKKNPYNGINTNIFTNGKYEFEIQYHTAESLKINGQMHKLYEKARILNKRSAEAIKLQDEMTNLSKNILKPNGVDEV